MIQPAFYITEEYSPLCIVGRPVWETHLQLYEGGCIFMPFYGQEEIEKAQERWSCSPPCKLTSRRGLSLFPGTSATPGSTTACVPMENGAGPPVGAAVTTRWIALSKSRAVLLWRRWHPSPPGLPPRRRPLRLSPRKKNRSVCFCRSMPQITGQCRAILKAMGFP